MYYFLLTPVSCTWVLCKHSITYLGSKHNFHHNKDSIYVYIYIYMHYACMYMYIFIFLFFALCTTDIFFLSYQKQFLFKNIMRPPYIIPIDNNEKLILCSTYLWDLKFICCLLLLFQPLDTVNHGCSFTTIPRYKFTSWLYHYVLSDWKETLAWIDWKSQCSPAVFLIWKNK